MDSREEKKEPLKRSWVAVRTKNPRRNVKPYNCKYYGINIFPNLSRIVAGGCSSSEVKLSCLSKGISCNSTKLVWLMSLYPRMHNRNNGL